MDKSKKGEEIYLAPETNNGDETIKTTFEMESDYDIKNDNKKKAAKKRVGEITELRGTNRKVFRMGDNTEQAVFYAKPVHVLDSDTRSYEEIDESVFESDDGKQLVCGRNHFVAKFSREENDELFRIEHEDKCVTVLSKKSKKNKKLIRPVVNKKSKRGAKHDTICFADVENGADYEYSVSANGVKEEIIIKEKANVYRYAFVLECKNVTAQFDEENMKIAFVDAVHKKEVFFIPAPFMIDANGVKSTSVYYEVKPAADGNIHLTITANSDWINAENRAFPVVIDPQIQISGNTNISTYSWEDGIVREDVYHKIGLVGNVPPFANDSSLPIEMQNAKPITLNNWVSDTIPCECCEVWYKFVASAGTCNYTISTQGSTDTRGYLYDSCGNLIKENDDSKGRNFSITAELTEGNTYYVKVREYYGKTGDYSIAVTCDSAGDDYSKYRMYMSFNMPTLPRNPRIKKAELVLSQHAGISDKSGYPKFGLYQVSDAINNGSCTPTICSNLIDFARIKIGSYEEGSVVKYAFDITTLIDQLNKNENSDSKFVLKMLDEDAASESYIELYGVSTNSELAPQIAVTYETNYGVNTSYRTHTHSLGRFGQGSIDLQCGNLMFESEDFAWGGNRMPVTIKHLYNSALSDYQYTANSAIKLLTANFDAMKLGHGFKLNIMQSMIQTAFQHEGVAYIGYVHIDANGNEVYFKHSEKCKLNASGVCYHLYEDVDSAEMLYDPELFTLTIGDETYLFDTVGRLISIEDQYNNKLTITYALNRIASVTDGAGREFGFDYYDGGYLKSITAPDGSHISYTYDGELLDTITYPDNRKAKITYNSNKPNSVILKDAEDSNVYKVEYIFDNERLVEVTEFGVENASFVAGEKSTYSYSVSSGRTTLQTYELVENAEQDCYESAIKTVYTFDDDGDVVSEYAYSEDTGNTGIEGEDSGINPYSGDGGAGVVSNINNLLSGHNFETLDNWTSMPSNSSIYIKNYAYEGYTKFGKKLLRLLTNNVDCTQNGVYQIVNDLPIGEYTLSVYARVITAFTGNEDAGAYIRVVAADGTVLTESEHLSAKESEYIRLIAPFNLETEQNVQVQLLVNGKGAVYFNAPQLENNPYANAYNMLENSNFENNVTSWKCLGDVISTSETCFNMKHSLKITGNVDDKCYASQVVMVKPSRSTRETFTLSGWAKGYGLPNHERDDVESTTFRLRAVIRYYDSAYREYGTEEYTADFSPCTEEWQLASVEFAKSKYRTIQSITIYCDYSNNIGVAYFDDIQLIRNSIETGLSASDFETAVDDDVVTADEADTVTSEGAGFKEKVDAFGNTLTETTFTDGEFGTIYRAFEFTKSTNESGNVNENAGNDLIAEIDARGNETLYTVDEDTSRNEEVIDRCSNKTLYEYDESGKTTKVTSKDADGAELANVSYGYDAFDNMTSIVRGDGMKYVLAYNAYHNLESIGVNGKDEKLVKYTYKSGNGRLKEMAYANGDKMKATYNGTGQLIAEKWFDINNTLTAHYKYTYDGQGNIVRSIDILACKEYNYEYDEGKVIRATECNITINADEIVVAKELVNTIFYVYDNDGTLVRKRIISANGDENIVNYETTDDNTVVKFTAGGKTVTSHSKTDSFGRKVFDELQLGTGFVSRQFSYLTGEVTDEHIDSEKLKSSPTTQLVSQIVLSDGRSISYEYDAEERITKVIDSIDGTTEYTYDALGQLKTEIVNGVIVNDMTYDNYGNILTKNGISYTYGDDVWKDKLTKVGDQEIIYDDQGNPTTYLGHTLTWEKGRQLKSFDNIQYTYNANGIRTSKTIDGVRHNFALDGSKILRETWGNNTLIPLYDNEETVCGIIYNDEPFYFHKNLQGDIIAIVDKTANIVAKYTYDAWGTCTITGDTSGCGISTLNPYRYRGYYFDQEIGLYYLQSRYYSPVVGRFINADEPIVLQIEKNIINANLFCYCKNEPIMNIDPFGYWVLTIGISWGIAAIMGINFFATLLIDSTWDYGIFIGATLLYGVVEKGLSGSLGIYWRFKKIKNYLDSVTVGFAVGFKVGGMLVYDYYNYPSSKKKFVGIQISFGTTGLYRETAPFDGGLYIPLKSKLKSFFASCGNNFSKLKKKIKNLKIKIYR
ncbi:MAG: RHS repeat-associated core domain-containing protein [Clostridia bacterium]|nr:RHS repeat-associated core domain-containing protein [Clostridia bacterium]